jgi:two-component system chemotaxis response regulator CheY
VFTVQYISQVEAFSPITAAGGMKRVLVVDDSATMRRMVIAALTSLGGLAFEQAVSGLDAIERVTMMPVDLVLLDLNMPDMHGLEVLRFIRGQAAFRSLPVVVLTTRGDEDSRAAALREGATLYLTKPFTPANIASEIRPLLQAV